MPPQSFTLPDPESSKVYPSSTSGDNRKQKIKQQLGNEMSYFYIPDRIYDEAEDQQGYMTGEELGSEEENINAPRLNNHSKVSGRVRRNVSFNDIRLQGERNDGVELEPMMASLLGVSFIPFDTRLTNDVGSSGHDSEILLSSGDEEEEDDDDDDDDIAYESDEDATLQEENTRIKKGRKKRGKKNGKRRGLRRLRRQLHERPRKERKERKRHWKRTKAKAKHRHMTNSVANNITSEMDRIAFGRKRLQIVKNSLRCADNEVKKLMGEAERSASRVSKLTKTITELECKLDMSLRALEQERESMQANMSALTNLNLSRDLLEKETKEIQIDLRHQLVQINDDDSAISYDSSVDLQDCPIQSTRHNRSRTNTGSSNISFATAIEQSGGTRSRSYTADSISTDSYDVDPFDVKIPAKLPKSPSSVKLLKSPSSRKPKIKRSSFLRIQDLEIVQCDSQVRDMLNCGNRNDLCSLDHEASHVALEALMQHAFAHVKDESSRWTPDGSSQKAISKRPEHERSWHYTGPDDLFVWHGKLEDAGYKGDLPVIKARGMIQSSPRELMDLLLDSSKVKLYNKMSLGRDDKFFIKKGLDTNDEKLDGEAKIVRSVSSVPVMRKKLELISLMYARRLDEEKDGMKGYICVNRSIWEDENIVPTEYEDFASNGDDKFIRCECLLGVNLIRELDSGFAEMTTLSHFFTPGAPTFGARQFGMKAAANFIKEIQNQFK